MLSDNKRHLKQLTSSDLIKIVIVKDEAFEDKAKCNCTDRLLMCVSVGVVKISCLRCDSKQTRREQLHCEIST